MSKQLLSLLQRVKKRRIKEKYGDSPKKMLYLILQEVKEVKHYGAFKNWELMTELLAQWLVRHGDLTNGSMGVIRPFEGLPEPGELYEHIDEQGWLQGFVEAAKKKPWDYIGEVYQELGLVGQGQDMTPRAVVELTLKTTFGDPWKFDAKLFSYYSYERYLLWYYAANHVHPSHLRPMEFPMQTQLDPTVGTGRFLIEASRLYPKAPLVQFGVEINLALYRACLVNMAMFSKHPFSIICADSLRLDPEKSGPSSPIWDLGNRWNPPDVSEFYS
ncbi:MAG: hypothetical protein U9O89_06590, partial [Thermoproteota archaeon]|nr:hypothetical protein [Thermoproteota archaeon]